MKIRRAGRVAVTLVLAAGAFVVFGQTVRYKPGDRVEVDVIMAGAPERGMWRAGTVKSLDAEAREVIVATDAATDNGGRKIGIPFQSAAKWLRPSAQPSPPTAPAAPEAPPRAPAPQAKAPPASTPSAAPPQPSAQRPQGILACPIDQPKVAQGSRPDPQLLAKVIRCLFEVQAQSAAERSIKVDIHSLEIGNSRDCIPREDFGCGLSGHKIFPALVRWTKTDYYTHSIQWSENESVFNCFVNPFGKWECGLGQRIRDGRLQTRER